MNALRNLPTPIKFALPIMLVVLLIAGVLLGTRGDGTVRIRTTTDVNQANALIWRLAQDKIIGTPRTNDTGATEIRVPEADAEKARMSIGGTDLSARIKSKGGQKCVAPSGLTSGQKQQQMYDNCRAEAAIQDQVMLPGVLAAKVNVMTEDSGSISGSDKSSNVTILLYLDPNESVSLDASTMAKKAANIVPGGSVERVQISTYNGETLWDGASAQRSANTTSEACGASDQMVDINTREAQVGACKESEIRDDISPIMGSGDRVQATVNVRLNPSSTSSVKEGSSASSSTSSTTSKGASSTSTAKEVVPTVTTEKTDTIAGGISSMSIAVTLDKKYATPERVQAVENILAGYVDAKRDPRPTVTVVEFAGSGSVPAGATDAAMPANASPANAASSNATTPSQITKSGVPMGVWIMGMLVLIILIAMGMVMMRRSAKDAARREAFERDVQQGQRMFQTFAADNPDHVAEDIMSLLGTPPSGRVPANN